MVEAANLPAKKITQGDGGASGPNAWGRNARSDKWIYGYYFPALSHKKFDMMYNHWEVAGHATSATNSTGTVASST